MLRWNSNVTVHEIAEILNLTPRRIQQLVREGVIPRPEHGKYELVASVRAYVTYLQKLVESRGVASKELHAERTRLFKEQADSMEIKNRLQRGEIVPVERVSVALGKVASAIATILDSIPTRCKRANPALTQADLDIIRTEIARARNECADLQPE